MAGIDSAKVNEHLVRTELWSAELKDVLQEQLQGTKYVRMLSGFPDGNQFTIPSVGELSMRETSENTPVVYDAMDTGEFTFSIDRYVESATFITDKAKQDSFYAQQLIGNTRIVFFGADIFLSAAVHRIQSRHSLQLKSMISASQKLLVNMTRRLLAAVLVAGSAAAWHVVHRTRSVVKI